MSLGLALAAGVFVPNHVARAAFPTTGILDNFNRANEDPLANGTWTCPARSGDGNLALNTNTVRSSAGSFSNCYWSAATFGSNTEAYVTENTVQAAGALSAVFVRATNVGASTFTAYWAEHLAVAGAANDTFTIYAVVNPHFLFELCVSGRMIEPTPVFMRL